MNSVPNGFNNICKMYCYCVCFADLISLIAIVSIFKNLATGNYFFFQFHDFLTQV